jgi:hypothetical protein
MLEVQALITINVVGQFQGAQPLHIKLPRRERRVWPGRNAGRSEHWIVLRGEPSADLELYISKHIVALQHRAPALNSQPCLLHRTIKIASGRGTVCNIERLQ